MSVLTFLLSFVSIEVTVQAYILVVLLFTDTVLAAGGGLRFQKRLGRGAVTPRCHST